MTLTSRAQDVLSQIGVSPKMGDLKKIAKEIKRDHELAMELWATGEYYARLLSVLIMDKKLLTQDVLDTLARDMEGHEYDQRNQIADWLLANQLTKDNSTIALMETWEHADSAILQSIFWNYQGRLRWTGKTPPDNTSVLMSSLEQGMEGAQPEVQRNMNFAAAQIGIFEPEYRARCTALGEKLGLYKDEPVPRGCTSPYLPLWIETEVAKLA